MREGASQWTWFHDVWTAVNIKRVKIHHNSTE
jgi:hypothetical protein